jgi:hypothetical protein
MAFVAESDFQFIIRALNTNIDGRQKARKRARAAYEITRLPLAATAAACMAVTA